MKKKLRVLFVAAEMAPLISVGGLGEVIGALPNALRERGHDVRVLVPAYDREMVQNARLVTLVSGGRMRLLERKATEESPPVWLLSSPSLLRRNKRIYLNRRGRPWADNPVQFARLSRVAADLALNNLPVKWQPDVVHCHDWHTALTALWMKQEGSLAASVFTIHNLGYMGRFSANLLPRLGVSAEHYRPDSLEFHGDIALIKAGLVYADWLTTVSPTHAEEIRTPTHGCGLEGLLQSRSDRLTGILNGIDTRRLPSPGGLPEKRRMRESLIAELALSPGIEGEPAILIWIGRLVEQKGIDLLIRALPALMERPVHLIVLGEGDQTSERALRAATRKFPGRLVFHAGFDEALAGRLYAGADLLLMPSRYEPCGLAQLHAMRCGTLPIASRTGGLLDTVFDPRSGAVKATGFLIDTMDPDGILQAVDRALEQRTQSPATWNRMIANAMARPCNWSQAAQAYEAVYDSALLGIVQQGKTRDAL